MRKLCNDLCLCKLNIYLESFTSITSYNNIIRNNCKRKKIVKFEVTQIFSYTKLNFPIILRLKSDKLKKFQNHTYM